MDENAYDLLTDPLMEAIDRRLKSKQAGNDMTAWWLADMQEQTERPYLVIMPVRESPAGYTNKARLVDVIFSLDVYADDWAQLSKLYGKLRRYIENAPLDFRDDPVPVWHALELSKMRPGDLVAVKDGDQWTGALEYTASLKMPLTHNPK